MRNHLPIWIFKLRNRSAKNFVAWPIIYLYTKKKRIYVIYRMWLIEELHRLIYLPDNFDYNTNFYKRCISLFRLVRKGNRHKDQLGNWKRLSEYHTWMEIYQMLVEWLYSKEFEYWRCCFETTEKKQNTIRHFIQIKG